MMFVVVVVVVSCFFCTFLWYGSGGGSLSLCFSNNFSIFIFSKAKQVRAVVVGYDPDVSYAKIKEGSTYLRRKKTIFLTCNDERVILTGDGAAVVSVPGNVSLSTAWCPLYLCQVTCLYLVPGVHCTYIR